MKKNAASSPEAELQKLKNLPEKFHLAAEELQRMEDEGGSLLPPKQAAKAEAYFKIEECLKKVLSFARRLRK